MSKKLYALKYTEFEDFFNPGDDLVWGCDQREWSTKMDSI
jgi:hypothetical protein